MKCKTCAVLKAEVERLKEKISDQCEYKKNEKKSLDKVDEPSVRRSSRLLKNTGNKNMNRDLVKGIVSPQPSTSSTKVNQGSNNTYEWRIPNKISNLKVIREPSPVMLTNKFSMLSEEEGDACIVGDSLVRGQGVSFGQRTRRKAKVTCFPGAGIEKLANSLPKSEGPFNATVICAGGNDVKSSTSPELRIKYRALLARLSERRSPTVVMGILPRLFENNIFANRAKEINRWLHIQCNERGILFIDLWDKFNKKRNLFMRDGIHLASQGRNILTDNINEVLNEKSIYRPFLE